MITRSRSLPLTRLNAVDNQRTRIFAAGADPKFGRSAPNRTLRLLPALPPGSAATPDGKLWRPTFLDRLHAPLTRYHE